MYQATEQNSQVHTDVYALVLTMPSPCFTSCLGTLLSKDM